MTVSGVFFLACALLCVVGAVGTVVAKNPIRGAMGLLATIVGIAGLFLLLSAQFLAAIQLIVYAGAVVVLFVFVIMLLGSDSGAVGEDRAPFAKLVSGAVMAVMAVGAIFALAPSADQATRFEPVSPTHGSVEAVGKMLFTEGIVPFEIATALLIVAVVGAIAVARDRQGATRMRPRLTNPKDLFVGPLMARDDRGRPTDVAPQGGAAE